MDQQGARDRSAFSRAFAEALVSRKRSLTRLHRQLADAGDPVSLATLSSWRSGTRHPDGAASLAAVERIEQLLDLEPGSLLDRVIRRSRLGALGDATTPFGSPGMDVVVAETLDELRAPPLGITRELSIQMTSEVDRDGNVAHRSFELLVQGVAPRVTEISYVMVSPPGRLVVPDFEVIGGRLDRLRKHETSQALAFVVALDRPLVHGATEMIGLRIDGPCVAPEDRETGSLAIRAVRNIVLWTRFHPEAVPDWADEMEVQVADAVEPVLRPIRPAVSIHQARHDFGPGALALRWGYGERG